MFASIAIDLAIDKLFSYRVPSEMEEVIAVGQFVQVVFNHRAATGFVMNLTEVPPEGVPSKKVRAVDRIVDEVPFFSAAMLRLVKWMAAYTCAPIELCLRTAIPASVMKPSARERQLLYVDIVTPLPSDLQLTKHQFALYENLQRVGGGWLQQVCREFKTSPSTLHNLEAAGAVTIAARTKRRDPLAGRRVLPSKPLPLNREQAAALEIIQSSSRPILLWGITGSGKTEVYLQAIAANLAAGRGAIVLVPEISLTPQTVRRFAGRFGDRVAVLHSALSDGERFDEWRRIRSGAAQVVIGPRSAIFAPVQNLGLIVVDEEHDPSYKQDETPRYHARNLAVVRAQLEGNDCRVVLGSATPSLETWHNAQTGKYTLATLAHRAAAQTLPDVCVVNMEEELQRNNGRASIFAQPLMDAIHTRLERGEQTILLLNRRGFARIYECGDCAWKAECPNCSVAYTYHKHDNCLRCHICGGWMPLPAQCPNCHGTNFERIGIGTQRAEEALHTCFPTARILRMDADSTSRKFSHDDILNAFRTNRADILLGTQMIAKGLDFPNVTLVGVINADASLNMPDPRAAERTFQLITQVSGRAGRAEKPGQVFIQTFAPEEYPIKTAAAADFLKFAELELAERRSAQLPPFTRMAALLFRSRDAIAVQKWAAAYAASLANWKDLMVSEANEAALAKAEGWFRYFITLRATNHQNIIAAYKWIIGALPPPPTVTVALDVDALSVM